MLIGVNSLILDTACYPVCPHLAFVSLCFRQPREGSRQIQNEHKIFNDYCIMDTDGYQHRKFCNQITYSILAVKTTHMQQILPQSLPDFHCTSTPIQNYVL